MIAEIIPLARLPKSLSYFDYEVPEDFEGQIKIGQMAKIPFRGRKMNGIVVKLKNKPDRIKSGLKQIIKIGDAAPELDENRLKLLWWMSNYYFASPALLLKTFIPEPPQRASKFKIKSEIRPAAPTVAPSAIPKIQENLKKFFASSKNNFLFHYQNQKNKIAFYLKTAAKILEQGKQVLILEPQITDIEILSSYFLYLFPGKIAILHGNLSKTEYWQEWQKIKNGRARIVIGARSAIFAPVQNLGLIIIDDEEMDDFKQSDQNPRYDSRQAALKLNELTDAKIILASQAPRVETYYSTKIGNCELLEEQDSLKTYGQLDYDLRLIDMNQELKRENFSPLSEELRAQIQKNLEQNKKIVLLLNRRGAATFVACRDCGYVFKCPDCAAPYTCHEDERHLPSKFLCHYCEKEEAARLVCPNCRGASIKYLGTGTQTVEREVKKIFPRAKVARIDKDIKPTSNFQPLTSNLFVGTQFFIKNFLPRVQNVGLIGIISADTLLFRPDFRSGEKIFQWLTKLINTGHQLKSAVLIQTFLPDNFVIQSATAKNYKNYEEFYKKEIEERRDSDYPPFSQLLKLIYSHINEKKCIFESFALYKHIKSSLGDEVEFLRNEKPKKEKRKFVAKIILKFQSQSFAKVINFLKIIPDGWVIDMDPESIL